MTEIENNIAYAIGYVRTTKYFGKGYQLFWLGTRNEVYPGMFFVSRAEARAYHKVQIIKQAKR